MQWRILHVRAASAKHQGPPHRAPEGRGPYERTATDLTVSSHTHLPRYTPVSQSSLPIPKLSSKYGTRT